MQCIANYEIQSEASVFEDGRWLKIQHPKGLFRARIRNIQRADFSTPFLLSLHLTFDAPKLDEAKDVAEERLADCLNMLTFTTGASFVRHRIRQIVDCTPGVQMRSCLIWGDAIEHEDPSPVLNDRILDSMHRLLTGDTSPATRRAMRWYRIGVSSLIPDDQFQCFWFALEIVALDQKSSEKVPSFCPKSDCRAPLYCQRCETHPLHMPFEKQKIRALAKAVDKDCDDATMDMLEAARNSLMHGATLKEIEEKLPQPREEIVDVLGRIVFKALLNQLPREIFKEKVNVVYPSTYVHYTATGVVHMQTVVPEDQDGEFDLSFAGTQVTMLSDGPPQSARPTLMFMTLNQHERLGGLSYEKGDHQEMCRRIWQRAEIRGEKVRTVVLSTDRVRILDALKCGEKGNWQDFFREIIGDSKPRDPGGATPPSST